MVEKRVTRKDGLGGVGVIQGFVDDAELTVKIYWGVMDGKQFVSVEPLINFIYFKEAKDGEGS